MRERVLGWLAVAVAAACLAAVATGCATSSQQAPDLGAGASVQQVDDLEGPEFRWVGNGQRTLGTVRVEQPSILRWVNDTGYDFDLRYDDPDGIAHDRFVMTEQREGSVPVEPGVYRNIYMSATPSGVWEITIEPR